MRRDGMWRDPSVRLLPVTIAAMAVLLTLKSTALVLAAVPEAAHPTPGGEAKPAAEKAKPEKPKAEAPKPETASAERPAAKPAEPAPPPAEPAVSDSERALLLDLRQRRTELDAREATLAAREAVLSATEKRLATRVDELTGLQARLEALEKGRAERDAANWAGLVKTYEAMKPRDAAAIFNDLDMAVLLPVLDRMKEAKAAAILAGMQPERARLATAQLAQLRARANTPTPAAAAPAAAPAAPTKAG